MTPDYRYFDEDNGHVPDEIRQEGLYLGDGVYVGADFFNQVCQEDIDEMHEDQREREEAESSINKHNTMSINEVIKNDITTKDGGSGHGMHRLESGITTTTTLVADDNRYPKRFLCKITLECSGSTEDRPLDSVDFLKSITLEKVKVCDDLRSDDEYHADLREIVDDKIRVHLSDDFPKYSQKTFFKSLSFGKASKFDVRRCEFFKQLDQCNNSDQDKGEVTLKFTLRRGELRRDEQKKGYYWGWICQWDDDKPRNLLSEHCKLYENLVSVTNALRNASGEENYAACPARWDKLISDLVCRIGSPEGLARVLEICAQTSVKSQLVLDDRVIHGIKINDPTREFLTNFAQSFPDGSTARTLIKFHELAENSKMDPEEALRIVKETNHPMVNRLTSVLDLVQDGHYSGLVELIQSILKDYEAKGTLFDL